MVKINDIIESLEKIRDEHGNLPILIEVDGFGGRSEHFCTKPTYEEQYFGDYDELVDNEESLSENEINFLVNSPKDTEGDNKVVTIGCGALLYST